MAQAVRQVRDVAMFLIDASGTLRSWNLGVEHLFGWTEADWLGHSAEVAFTEEDIAAGVPHRELQQAQAAGRAEDRRWMRRRDGERFYADSSLTAIHDGTGHPLAYLKVLRDATHEHHTFKECERALRSEQRLRAEAEQRLDALMAERRKLEDKRRELAALTTQLRERDEEFRALVRGVRDYAIFTIGVDGLVSSWHVGAQLMKGYTAEEAVGMPFARLFLPAEREAGQPQREMDIAARTGEYKGEGRRLRKDGETFEAAVVLTALRGPDEQLLGYLKLTQDITQRKQAEAQREQMLRDAQAARADAERASRSKDEFLATISHELRTPLSAILGWARLLERGMSDPNGVKQGLAAISRNARVQVQLIEDLLDMSRIESGQIRLELQPVDLANVVAGALESVLPTANTKNIGLRTLFDADLGPVLADAARLQQVIWNLLSNAVKFTPEGGQVTVAVRRRAGQVDIRVEDTGQGMEADFLARAFDRFQQQDATRTRRYGGLGLGLAIVRQLTQLHGGTVRAESPGPGQGATFIVSLPAQGLAQGTRLPPAEAPAAPAPRDEEGRLAGLRLLLIDDEADSRTVAGYALRSAGADVIEAAGAQEGLALFRAHRPQAILCDIGMPRHDGYDFIGWVRALEHDEGRQTPAAAFTAFTRPEDRQRALAAGYQAHLAKPLDPASLVRAVVSMLQAEPGDTR